MKGKIIIAPPVDTGSLWDRTIILITEHDKNGSTGIILNKPSQMKMEDFGERLGHTILDANDDVVHIGGPVKPTSVSFLHTNDWKSSNTLIINDKMSISSAADIVPRMAKGDRPRLWRLMLGMCSWEPDQLRGEIDATPPWDHSLQWCVTSSNLSLIFDNDEEDQWTRALDQCGIEFAQNMML